MRRILSFGLIGLVFAGIDLVWLGSVGRPLYDAASGPLMRKPVYWPAAALFYLFYVAAIERVALRPATSAADAGRRGAGLGLVCYTVYELTNWAVLAGWTWWIVPIDIAWGVLLTGAVPAIAFALLHRRAGNTPA